MENIKLHKSNDLVSGIFKSSPGGAQKYTSPKYFFKFQEIVSLVKFATT